MVVHCDTEQQARQLWADLGAARVLGLALHPVVLQRHERRDEAEHTSFDFLGYTFGAVWPVADKAFS